MKLIRRDWILCILFLGLVFAYSFNAIKDSDSFYHLKTGQIIFETHTVPHADIFSYTASGALWVTHEWLAEVVLYLVSFVMGFWGLIVFVALVGVITYWILFKTATEEGSNMHLTLFLMPIVAYVSFALWIPRPQIFAALVCAFLIYFLRRYGREGKRLFLIFAFLDLWLWANVHASFILGLVILIYFAGYELFAKRWPRIFGSPMHEHSFRDLSIFTLAATAISFVNPNTYHIFFYSFYIKSTAASLNLLEWRSVIAYLYQLKIQLFVAELVLSVGFLIWWLGLRRETRDVRTLGLVLGVSVLPFISVRHIFFWIVVAIPPLLVTVSSAVRPWVLRIASSRVFSATLFLFAALLFGRVFTFPRMYYNEAIIPVHAVDFVEANHLEGPLFNLYNEGGYLISRLYPRERVAIDGRSEVYAGKPLDDFLRMATGHRGFLDLFEKYRVNYAFLSYRPASVAASIEPLVFALMKEGWQLIYWDDTTVIYVKNTPENQTVIQKFSLSHVSPFRDPKSIPESEGKVAAAEFQSLLLRSPNSTVVQSYLKQFLQSRTVD